MRETIASLKERMAALEEEYALLLALFNERQREHYEALRKLEKLREYVAKLTE